MKKRDKKRITEIWFDGGFIYGKDEAGKVLVQSLLWYPRLREASNEERGRYRFGREGIHWRELDEDVSFESFWYGDAIPSPLQMFFLQHKEINIAEFANRVGINPTLLRNYINGFKKPSPARSRLIMNKIKELGEEYINAYALTKSA